MVGLISVWLAAVALAQDPTALFTPVDQSVVSEGKLRVAGRAAGKAELLLDGKATPHTSPGPGAVMADLTLTPGAHELVLRGEGGEAKARFFVGKEHGDWKLFRPHAPVAAGCDTCHAVKNDTWALKRASLSPLCHTCHEKEKFPVVHTHNTDTLADCQNCHMPHGSAAKGHLVKPKEALCKQCHS